MFVERSSPFWLNAVGRVLWTALLSIFSRVERSSEVGLGEPITRLELGRSFGSYTLVSTLGRGGMGEVFLARDSTLDRDVAIKVLPAAFVSDPERVARFRREAKTLAALNHPNIAAIYELEDRDGLLGLVLELVEGPTLADRIAQGPVHIYEALLIATQIAEALEVAHARGIVHRDLKPANIKLRPDGMVKVLDFGLAKGPAALDARPPTADDAATEPGLTGAGVILGTVGYMSPEQAAGRPTDLASDQFSFGVILYELLTGCRPFERPTSVETLSAIIRDEPPAIQTINPAVTSPLLQIVERCLKKHPRDRYGDTRQLTVLMRHIRDHWNADDTRFVNAGFDGETHLQTPAVETRARVFPRRRMLWLAGSVLVALSAVVAGWQLWPRGSGVRALAVLPFANAANDADIDYLCDGITESLIQQISRLPSLTVMARSTVFNFKGKPIDPRAAGRQLGVDAILTGTVSQRSGELRITAELVEVATGVQLWGNATTVPPRRWSPFRSKSPTPSSPTGSGSRLSGAERRALLQHPTDNAEAYEWYLRARHATFQGTEAGFLQARELLERAIARDPRFAQAYKLLAATYTNLALDGFERPIDAFPAANRHVARAFEIDPQLAEAHSVMASIAFFFDWDWVTAEREWTIANRLPSGALPTQELVGHSLGQWVLDGPEEALRVVRRLRVLDPLSVSYAVLEADFLFHSGQLDAAAALYQKALDDEVTPGALFGLAEVRYTQGRFAEALEVRRRAHEAAGDDALLDLFDTARGAEGYRMIERKAVELELEALAARPTAYVSPLDFARAHAQLGNREEAFSYFDAAFADRAPGLVFLKVDKAWDPYPRRSSFPRGRASRGTAVNVAGQGRAGCIVSSITYSGGRMNTRLVAAVLLLGGSERPSRCWRAEKISVGIRGTRFQRPHPPAPPRRF